MNLTANEKKAATARQRRYVLLLAVMLVLLFIIIVLSFWVGYYPLTPVQVLNAFLSKFGFKGDILPQAVTIFWNIRLPRILSALFIGASLSVAGATYQGMFRNPLVSPDILGVSSGASLGAAFAILNGQLDDSTFCFCRWCSRSSRILSYQPKIRTFPDSQSCSDRNYDHVTLQCRCHNDQICGRP